MSDNKSKAGSPDRDRINLSEAYEIRDWTQSLGCTEAQLREVVGKVGNSADKVREHLRSHK